MSLECYGLEPSVARRFRLRLTIDSEKNVNMDLNLGPVSMILDSLLILIDEHPGNMSNGG